MSARVEAAILAAVAGGILPPDPPGRMPGDTAGRDACRYRQLADAPRARRKIKLPDSDGLDEKEWQKRLFS